MKRRPVLLSRVALALASLAVVLTACGTAGSGATKSASPSPVTSYPKRGDLWVTDCATNALYEVASASLDTSPGASSAITSGMNCPKGIAFDASGDLWVSNHGTSGTPGASVVEYAAGALGSNPSPALTLSNGVSTPNAIAFDASGNLWVVNGGTGAVNEYAGTALAQNPAPEATLTSGLAAPQGLAFDASGDLWVASYGNSSSGPTVVEYAAATLGPSAPTSATIPLAAPAEGLAFDKHGDLWVALTDQKAVMYAAASLGSNPASPDLSVGYVPNYGGVAGAPVGIAFDAVGDLWVSHSSLAGESVDEFSAGSLTSGATPVLASSVRNVANAQMVAFDPPPAGLPLAP